MQHKGFKHETGLTSCEQDHVALLGCLGDSSSTASLCSIAAIHASLLPKFNRHHEPSPSDVDDGVLLAQL